MVNKNNIRKNNMPHGWGRLINTSNCYYTDGQWEEGREHGYARMIG